MQEHSSTAITRTELRAAFRFAKSLAPIFAREREIIEHLNYQVLGYPLGKSNRGFKKWQKQRKDKKL